MGERNRPRNRNETRNKKILKKKALFPLNYQAGVFLPKPLKLRNPESEEIEENVTRNRSRAHHTSKTIGSSSFTWSASGRRGCFTQRSLCCTTAWRVGGRFQGLALRPPRVTLYQSPREVPGVPAGWNGSFNPPPPPSHRARN